MPTPMAQFETMASRGDSFEADRRLSFQGDRPVSPRGSEGMPSPRGGAGSEPEERSPLDYASVCIGASHSSPATRRKQSSQFLSLERTRSSSRGLVQSPPVPEEPLQPPPAPPPAVAELPTLTAAAPVSASLHSPIPSSPARTPGHHTPSGVQTPQEMLYGSASSVGLHRAAAPAPGAALMSAASSGVEEGEVALPGPGPDTICNQGRLLSMGKEVEELGLVPKGGAQACIAQEAQVFEVAKSGGLHEMLGLLKKHPLLWKTTDADGCQPLHVAAEAGRLEMAQLLAQAAATAFDPRARDHDGWEPLHYASFNGHLGTAEWLLQTGADVAAESNDLWQPLHASVDAGHTQVARFLGARGADLRARTADGNEPIHVAADKGHMVIVQWLVRTTKGACICAQDGDGWQPLHNAAINGHLEVVKWLWGQRGRYPSVDLRATSNDGWQALHAAASGGQLEVVRWLVNRGAQITARTNDGWEPLHAAAHGGHLAVVTWLVEHGASIRARADNGDEPLLLAAASAQQPVVDWLVSAWLMRQAADGAMLDAGSSASLPDSLVEGLPAEQKAQLETLMAGGASPATDALATPRGLHTPRISRRGSAASGRRSLTSQPSDGGFVAPPPASSPDRPQNVPKLLLPGKEAAPPAQPPAQQPSQPGLLGGVVDAVGSFFGGSKKDLAAAAAAPPEGADAPAAHAASSAALSAEEAAIVRIQSAARQMQACRVFAVKLMMRRLMVLMANAERRHVKCIQQHYRDHLKRKRGELEPEVGVAPGAEAAEAVSTDLLDALRLQAARVIQTTLDKALLMNKLRTELRALMEKGKSYPMGSGELVAWSVRFFYVNDAGLCYQHVTRKMRPRGIAKVIPWVDITKVEARVDDSIYVETRAHKKYYLKLKGATRPAMESWMWATHLCQFAQLLKHEVSGYVAEVAYGARPDLAAYVPPPMGRIPSAKRAGAPAGASKRGSAAAMPAAIPEDAPLPDGSIAAPRLDEGAGALAVDATPRGGPTVAHNLKTGESPSDSSELDEGEETAEEAQRRQQWIEYYVSIGQYTEAEDIGWDLEFPPDPRAAAQPACGSNSDFMCSGGPMYASNYEAGQAYQPKCAPATAAAAAGRSSGGLFGRSKSGKGLKGEAQPLLQAQPSDQFSPQTPKQTQMQWVEAGVERGLITPSSGGTGGHTPAAQCASATDTPPG